MIMLVYLLRINGLLYTFRSAFESWSFYRHVHRRLSAVIIGGVEVVGRESEEIKFLLFG